MGFLRHFLPQHHFLLSEVYGEINSKDLFEHIFEINKLAENTDSLLELADCRGITEINLHTDDVVTSADIETDKIDSKLAILAPENNKLVYGMINAYRMFAEEHRQQVKIFTDVEQALSWLTDDKTQIDIFRKQVEDNLKI